MNGFNFTERVRKVLAMAREECARLRHEYVGTEHLLLGLIREGEGVAAAVLQNLKVDLDEVRDVIEKHVKKGRAAPNPGPDLPYTTRAKAVLELAMAEARELGHEYVGTEHILLGLVREERGIAAQVLKSLGLELDAARREAVRLLGTQMPERHTHAGRVEASGALPPVRVTVQIDYEGGAWSEDSFDTVADAIAFLRNLSPPGSNGGDSPAGATPS